MSKGSTSICQMLTEEDKEEGCCICCWWRTCPWRWLWGWTCWIWGTCWAGSIEGCDWVWDCWTDGLCCCFFCSYNTNSSGFSHCRLVPVNISSTGIIKIAKIMATQINSYPTFTSDTIIVVLEALRRYMFCPITFDKSHVLVYCW